MSDILDFENKFKQKTNKLKEKQHTKQDMHRCLYDWVKEGKVTLKLYVAINDWIEKHWQN